MHHVDNYCAMMVAISELKTDSQEWEAKEYLQIKEFTCVGEEIGGGFQNTKYLHMATNDTK